jgi:manganese transport protein
VIVLSNFVGCLLQHLAVRLGAGVSRDLAQACREYYPRPVARLLWVLAECAIAATDLAEVLGSAIALDILFGLPLLAGVLITAADVLLLLLLNGQNARTCEALVFCLMAIIATCLIFTLVQAGAPVGQVMQGLIPKRRILTNSNELYAAIGIMGATVMPHNLFLHSSLVQSRRFMKDAGGRWQAISYGTVDGTVSLFLAMFINAAILVVAAAAFYGKGPAVEDIHEAVSLLAPALGSAAASTLFAVGLLAAGQQSTLTGTLAGQIVLEGFMGTSVALKPWARRLATRMVAIVPAVAVAASSGAEGVSKLLTLSQVVLSLALPFCMFPLVHFTGSRAIMGDFVAPRPLRALCWLIFLCITALNGKLLYDFSTEDA